MTRDRIEYSVGNEHNPGDPWGRSELVIEADGSARLEQTARTGTSAWTGTFTALDELFAALETANFPTVPKHRPPGGATIRQLGVGDVAVYVEYDAAKKFAGYDRAFELLDLAIRQLSGGTIAYVPAGPTVVIEIRAV